ncbi:MAG TPA: EscU/YscU/HrcU family type III secretion system export apparatus switch protein [Syntrophales bacterium]|nr:EscU/YscU/HrcU family type III secretion system export apparatus switch protein [Syntrophales bacterium]HPX55136.1 EscU/YscU/HrcU family type III secretion system export apparatus switch protein [Syntrophales bacterium]HQA82693.1 EscU/YscU/HrcU family type III secretion system export apparatus switch protein [Syntrophales bacterium]
MKRKKNHETRQDRKRTVAAAIQYDPLKDAAPRVTAKGRGCVADRIIELAKKHDIPIKSDPGLVEILSRLDIDEQIPVNVYRAVAEILVFVYNLNADRPSGGPSRS